MPKIKKASHITNIITSKKIIFKTIFQKKGQILREYFFHHFFVFELNKKGRRFLYNLSNEFFGRPFFSLYIKRTVFLHARIGAGGNFANFFSFAFSQNAKI